MRLSLIVMVLVGLPALASGQTEKTDYVSISSRSLRGTYRREIKIDRLTGDVFRKKSHSDKYVLLPKLKNDSATIFLKDSISFNKLDHLVNKKGFDEVGYKIEFTYKECLSFYPCRTHTNTIEFGINTESEELRRIIYQYISLRSKAKI